MRAGGGGLPDPDDIVTIKSGGGGPVNLIVGPGDDIFYPGFDDGRLHRIQHFVGNLPPTAVAQADPTNGLTPLVVTFDGTGSSDPEGESLTYAWDLDADGSFDDSSSPTPQWSYSGSGTVVARLRVTDSGDLFDVAAVSISVNNSAPVAIIDTPVGSLTWKVGDPIAFTGRGTDVDEPSGLLPPTAMHWDLVMHHCPSNCHTHLIQSFEGVAGGSFAAPDHEYPSYLELRLTVADPEGVPSTASVLLHPRAVTVTLQSDPPGLRLSMNADDSGRALHAHGHRRLGELGRCARRRSGLGGLPRQFSSWSDGGAQNHILVAPASPATYTASFVVPPVPAEVCGDGLDNDGDGVIDGNCGANPATTAPGAPVRLTSRVQGTTVTLAWSAPITGGAPTTYVLEAGLAPGQAAYQVPLGLLTSVSVPNVGPGRYYARVRAMNAVGASAVSNEVAATVGCTTRPGAPTLTSAVNGGLVRLAWSDPDGCSGTTYRLLVGSQPGAANLGEIAVSDTVFATAAPPGTYYVRVVAQTALGSSDPSNEVTLAVGSGCAPPTLDSILGATLTGNQVTLQWNPVAPSAALAADAAWPMAYRLEVGSAAGAANLFVFPVGRTTAMSAAAPAGVYYARVRAADACGAGPPSNDVVISVPERSNRRATSRPSPASKGCVRGMAHRPGPGPAAAVRRDRRGRRRRRVGGQAGLRRPRVDARRRRHLVPHRRRQAAGSASTSSGTTCRSPRSRRTSSTPSSRSRTIGSSVHPGVDPIARGAGGRPQRARAGHGGGRQHHHPAAGAHALPVEPQELLAQGARGGAVGAHRSRSSPRSRSSSCISTAST